MRAYSKVFNTGEPNPDTIQARMSVHVYEQDAKKESEKGNKPVKSEVELPKQPEILPENPDEPEIEEETLEELKKQLQLQYTELTGKKPFYGWTIEQLREQIARNQQVDETI